MNWFEKLVGIQENTPDQVRSELQLDGEFLVSKANDTRLRCGNLEVPSLAELRRRSASEGSAAAPLQLAEVVGDVQQLHQLPDNDGALFQVASQFNLLEMVGPGVPPEHGVGIYEYDRTQGPACAIACGAATILRNYFVELDGHIGQSAERQIDCLADLKSALGNQQGSLWNMKNGYALATDYGLKVVNELLERGDESSRDRLRAKLRIGTQWRAGVTLGESRNVVTQAFCSAMPVAYSHLGPSAWQPFAKLILEAAYEATLHAAVINRAQTGSAKVFLTLLGGGAFGNPSDWIIDAIARALDLMRDSGLEVKIVSHGSPSPELRRLGV